MLSPRSNQPGVGPGSRPSLPVIFALVFSSLTCTASQAVEVLSTRELVSRCKGLVADPEGTDAQYCLRYIQGFIAGAVATDARVMLNTEAQLKGKETFSERALRTRVPNRAERIRASRLAGFCLGDSLSLRKVVDVVVEDLAALEAGPKANTPAREAVYQSLVSRFPCPRDS